MFYESSSVKLMIFVQNFRSIRNLQAKLKSQQQAQAQREEVRIIKIQNNIIITETGYSPSHIGNNSFIQKYVLDPFH